LRFGIDQAGLKLPQFCSFPGLLAFINNDASALAIGPGITAVEISGGMMATSSSANAGPVNDDIQKLLLVVKDLAHHLEENRQATTKLKLHADLLNVRTLHK